MKRLSLVIFLLITTGFLSLQGCTSSKHKKVETETFLLSSDGKEDFNLENVNGKITISPSDIEGQIKIIATKTLGVRKKNLDKPLTDIEIEIDSSGSAISISTKMKKRGGLFRSRGEAKVEYQIFLPPDIMTKITNVNGSITADDVSNQLKIEVVNGSITLNDCTGEVRLETVNGKILCSTHETQGINISTVNGSVDIQIPNSINANISASYQNGGFSYDEMKFKDLKQESKKLFAKIGESTDIDISVETVNGKISFSEYNGDKKIDFKQSIEEAEKELQDIEKMLEEKQKEFEELQSKEKDTTSN